MTPKEAIKCIDDVMDSTYNYDETIDYQLTSDDFDWLEKAKEALEKQIPKKPILKSGVSLIHINKGDKPHEWRNVQWQDWTCPECGWFVGQRYNATQCKPHDQRKCNYCNECGQAIDWRDVE